MLLWTSLVEGAPDAWIESRQQLLIEIGSEFAETRLGLVVSGPPPFQLRADSATARMYRPSSVTTSRSPFWTCGVMLSLWTATNGGHTPLTPNSTPAMNPKITTPSTTSQTASGTLGGAGQPRGSRPRAAPRSPSPARRSARRAAWRVAQRRESPVRHFHQVMQSSPRHVKRVHQGVKRWCAYLTMWCYEFIKPRQTPYTWILPRASSEVLSKYQRSSIHAVEKL